MPGEAVTGGNSLNSFIIVVDCQIEGVHIRTAGAWLAVVVGIGAWGGIGRAIPWVAVTSGDSVDECGAVADSQVQGVCTGAVISIRIVVSVCSCIGVVGIMPSVAVADINIYWIMSALKDAEIESYCTVTT